MILATFNLNTVSLALECRQNVLTLWKHFEQKNAMKQCLDIWYQGTVAFYSVHPSSRKTMDKLMPHMHTSYWEHISPWDCHAFVSWCAAHHIIVVSTLASWSFLQKEKEYTWKRRKRRSKGKSRVGKKSSKILWLKEMPTQCLPKARQINSTMKIWKIILHQDLYIF